MFPSLQALGTDRKMTLRSSQVQNEVDRLVLQQCIYALNLQPKLFSSFHGVRMQRVGTAYDGQFREILRRLHISGTDKSRSDNANTGWRAHIKRSRSQDPIFGWHRKRIVIRIPALG